ncbi:MAG: hypothetical protein LBU43_07860 [Candidatus Accumulibacter sp.]|nr:hypothetical protein [Accumulibacter sp.]
MNTKQLRQKILDLAIHGKLVPQNSRHSSAGFVVVRLANPDFRFSEIHWGRLFVGTVIERFP